MGVLVFADLDTEQAFHKDDVAAEKLDEYLSQGLTPGEALQKARADAVSATIALGREG